MKKKELNREANFNADGTLLETSKILFSKFIRKLEVEGRICSRYDNQSMKMRTFLQNSDTELFESDLKEIYWEYITDKCSDDLDEYLKYYNDNLYIYNRTNKLK